MCSRHAKDCTKTARAAVGCARGVTCYFWLEHVLCTSGRAVHGVRFKPVSALAGEGSNPSSRTFFLPLRTHAACHRVCGVRAAPLFTAPVALYSLRNGTRQNARTSFASILSFRRQTHNPCHLHVIKRHCVYLQTP